MFGRVRRWASMAFAGSVLLTLPACTLARDASAHVAINCDPATPDQVARQSDRQALEAKAALAALRGAAPAAGVQIEIRSTEGGDDSATIEAALQRARLIRQEIGQPATLLFAPGRYRLSRPIVLTAADSGTPDAPLRFAASPGGPVILSGGAPLAAQPLPAPLAALLSPVQRKAISGYAVPPQFVPSPPFPPQRGSGIFGTAPSLFVLQGDRPIWRSVFPDDGYAVEPVANPQPGPVVVPRLTIPAGQPQLRQEPSLQAGGYWTFDWAYDENQAVFDPAEERRGSGPARLALPQLKTRYAQSRRMRYRLFNGFSFLNRPGEMAYADGALAAYAWPGGAPVEVAANDTLLSISSAHNIRFDGLALQGARKDAIVITGAHDISFSNAYVGLAAGSAILIRNSRDIVVERSVITDVGEYGIAIDSDAETPSGRVLVADNIFTRIAQLTRSKRAAILMGGHDNVAMGNAISNTPHRAIIFGGLRNLIVGNEIFSVLLETSDSGAIGSYYDLSSAYNTITQNYFHDIATSPNLTQTGGSRVVRDIYFDGWSSFNSATNNLADTEAMPYFINSGYGNVIKSNIWFLGGGAGGAIYDYSHHRNDATGKSVFNSAAALKLAACSTNLNTRFDPAFLLDGKPRANVIAGNFNIGGRSIDIPVKVAALQQVSGERVLSPVALGQSRSLASLLEHARRLGAPVGTYLQSADRTAALQTLRYRSRQEP
jgi:hypothetical protein